MFNLGIPYGAKVGLKLRLGGQPASCWIITDQQIPVKMQWPCWCSNTFWLETVCSDEPILVTRESMVDLSCWKSDYIWPHEWQWLLGGLDLIEVVSEVDCTLLLFTTWCCFVGVLMFFIGDVRFFLVMLDDASLVWYLVIIFYGFLMFYWCCKIFYRIFWVKFVRVAFFAAIMFIFFIADASYSEKQPNERTWISVNFLLRLNRCVEYQHDLW